MVRRAGDHAGATHERAGRGTSGTRRPRRRAAHGEGQARHLVERRQIGSGARNPGYGTAAHRTVLKRYGVRVTFTPDLTERDESVTAYIQFVQRILRALERRVAHADVEAL